MHFSRLRLNHRSRAVRRDLSNPYEMHRTVLRAFPSIELGGPGRVLWRCDTDRRSRRSTVLVQSEKSPNWPAILLECDQYVEEGEVGIETKERTLAFNAGQILVFRLRANPTVKRDGKRHGILREEDQLAWLARKAGLGGFALRGVQAQRENDIRAWRPQKPPMSFTSVVFEGVLEVQSAQQMDETVCSGIGSAKGFGFGLLSLARA